jgi:uncharacterized protein (TIGR03435 family)
MSQFTAGVLLAVWTCAIPGSAQTVDSSPKFEVASVKLAGPPAPGLDDGMHGGPGTSDPTQITYHRVYLISLLATAFSLPADQIVAPESILPAQPEAYGIVAKLPPNTTKDQLRVMFQNLLTERFHLAFHWGTKQFPAYELVLASGGPKMNPESLADASAAPTAPPVVGSMKLDPNGFPVLPPGVLTNTRYADGLVRSTNRMTMAQFAKMLGYMLVQSNGGDPTDPVPRVVDNTNLAGRYEFTLAFAGSFGMPRSVAAQIAASGGDTGSQQPGGGPSLFTALEKQLGLKLVKAKNVTLDVLIIDHLDRVPTPN